MSLAEADSKNSFNSLIESKVWLLLAKISNFLAGQDIKSHVVGGLVHNMLLGRPTADIDIAIDTDALEVVPKIAATLGIKDRPSEVAPARTISGLCFLISLTSSAA